MVLFMDFRMLPINIEKLTRKELLPRKLFRFPNCFLAAYIKKSVSGLSVDCLSPTIVPHSQLNSKERPQSLLTYCAGSYCYFLRR